MVYNPRKEPKDYMRLAEYLCIQIGDKNTLRGHKAAVTLLASALADECNRAYDEAIIDIGSLRHD
jgi:hypothetical protein